MTRIEELEKIIAIEKRDAANRITELRKAHAITRAQLDGKVIALAAVTAERDARPTMGDISAVEALLSLTVTERDAALDALRAIDEAIEKTTLAQVLAQSASGGYAGQ